MRTRSRFIQVITALATAAALAGCATGPTFKSPEAAPADRALLYIYRPMVLIGGGTSHKVSIDGQIETLSLPNASWQRVLLAPGAHSVAIRDYFNVMYCTPPTLTLDLQAGQTAFVADNVKTTQGLGALYISCGVSIRPQEQALKEMIGLSGAE